MTVLTPLADRPWSFLWRFIRPNAALLAPIGLIGVVQSVLGLPMLYAVRYAFNTAIPKADIRLLLLIGVALLGIRLITIVLALFNRRLSLHVAKSAIADMRISLMRRLYDTPESLFTREDPSLLQTRIVQETERVDNLTSSLTSSFLPSLLTCLALGAVLIYLNVYLTLLLACVLPAIWLVTTFTGRHVRQAVGEFQHHFELFSRGVHFVLRQMDLTRSLGFENEELVRRATQIEDLRRSGVRMAMSYAISGQALSVLTAIGGVVFLAGGGVAVASGAMSIGDLMAFYLAAGLFNGTMGQVTAIVPDLIAGQESLKKLSSLWADAAPTDYGGDQRIDFKGRIALSGVSFGHGAELILDKLDLEITPRSNIAIVGPNGAGKSTIIGLILGAHRPSRGVITAEGVSYEDADLRALRRSIGVVLQKPSFFTGTIAENIGYGWPGASRADVEGAAQIAQAHAFVSTLPGGYDARIGEGGASLSGGEAQRLAIARALVGKPKLLILDEPTNHLDADSVLKIMRRLTETADRPAVLTISHDPSVIRFASRVLRLERRTLVDIRDDKPIPAAVSE